MFRLKVDMYLAKTKVGHCSEMAGMVNKAATVLPTISRC